MLTKEKIKEIVEKWIEQKYPSYTAMTKEGGEGASHSKLDKITKVKETKEGLLIEFKFSFSYTPASEINEEYITYYRGKLLLDKDGNILQEEGREIR